MPAIYFFYGIIFINLLSLVMIYTTFYVNIILQGILKLYYGFMVGSEGGKVTSMFLGPMAE